MKRISMLLTLVSCIAGCTTTGIDRADSVIRVTSNPDVVKECRFVGNVRVRSTAFFDEGQDRVINGMRKAAKKLGGNVVFRATWLQRGLTRKAAAKHMPAP